ncbi:MAG: hypothetical protein JW741_29565, partial [Sedimentisphaerales bacterium]|nr:hypothetical protein [Sedimentisphaerales bacterium]
MDIDGDGCNDVLSGSWPGELFLFKGGPDHTFAAPEMIKYKDGEIINIGGGIRETQNMFGGSEKMILIAGSAEFERTDEGTFALYHGQRIKSTPEEPIG